MKQYYIILLAVIFSNLCNHAAAQNETQTDRPLPPDSLQSESNDALVDFLNELPARSMPSVVPSSPQSQIFEKYVNHKVTEYNGLPDISIPLYVVEIKGLKIPVALSYHAGGIKYKQYDGDIGAGWSMNAGGYRVSRNVYGKPDEAYPFYDKALVNKYMTGGYSPYSRDSLLASIGLSARAAIPIEPSIGINVKDGEYDQFTYMLPSTNGHFIISDRTIRSVSIASENQDLITLDEGGSKLSLGNISITDNGGMKYLLGRSDLSPYSKEYVPDPSTNLNMTTGWLLSRIESPFNEYVLFKYNQHIVYTERFRSKSYVVTDAPEHTPSNYPLTSNPGLTTTYNARMENQFNSDGSVLMLVSSVETDDVIITFLRENVYSCNSDNAPSVSDCSAHVLKEMIVKDKKNGTQLKKITFDYIKSPSDANTNSNNVPWHRLLSSISVKDGSSQSVQKYQFEYYPAPATPSYTYSDQWGYYKAGYANSTVWPDMFLHDEFKTDNIVNQIGRSAVSKTPFGQLEPLLPFVSRSTNDAAPNFFALKRITYPTGGFTEYEYESNQYGSLGTKGCGLRVKKITSQTDASTKALVSEYTYGDNGSGVLSGSLSLFKYCFSDEIYYFTNLKVPPFGDIDKYELGTRQAIKTYSTKPLDKDTELFLKVSYNKVTAKQYNAASGGYIGKTISTYNTPFDYELSYENNAPKIIMGDQKFFVSNHQGYGNSFTKTYRVGDTPFQTSRAVYNEGGTLLEKDDFEYIELGNKTWEGINVKQKIFFENYPGVTGNLQYSKYYQSISSMFNWGYYSIRMGVKKLSGQVSIRYDQNGQNPATTTQSYIYDTAGRLTKSTQTNSLGGIRSKEFTYPASGTALNNKNMVATVVQTVVKNNNVETERVVHNYPSSAILPDKTQHANGSGSALQTDITYDFYDSHGNLLQYTRSDGTKVSYIWSYNYQYPVAEIVNAGLSEIYAYIPQSTVNDLASKTVPASTDWSALTNLRNGLKTGRVTIYKYKTLVGITEMTDPTGFTTYYDYDSYGRLIKSYYKEGSSTYIIESYNYNNINK